MNSVADPGNTPVSPTFPVVGIGASAGGLEAISELMSEVPALTGMAFLVVQHLDASRHSLLPEILAKRVAMPVQEAIEGMVIEPDHLYTIPANARMFVIDRQIRLQPRDETLGPPMPIDDLLGSLAKDLGGEAIGVILSGSGSDGALGLQAVQAEGGITFAQDASALFNSMPHAAIGLGCVDRVLAPREIAKEITRIGKHPHLRSVDGPKGGPRESADYDYRPIYRLLQNACNIDFTRYKSGTIERRLSRRMALRQLSSMKEYVSVLESEPAETQALGRDLLIHVTEFFRDPETFEALTQSVFPRLMGDDHIGVALRIWVPGCATGEEVYSLAICLLEYLDHHGKTASIQIFGTDISPEALETARTGRYIENIARNVSLERLERFFVRDGEYYCVSKNVRDLCTFARHDIVSDPPFSRMNLISCRNLLIYLSAAAQRSVMPLFHYALKPDGVLMLGPSETVGAFSELFAIIDNKRSKLYSKKPRIGPPAEMRLAPSLVPPTKIRSRSAAGDQRGPDDATLLRAEVDRVSLARYVPPSVLCDDDLNIIEFRGDTSAWLVNPNGPPSTNLDRLAKREVFPALNDAIRQARHDGVSVRKSSFHTGIDGAQIIASLEVHPIRTAGVEGRWFLIFFEDATGQTSGSARPANESFRTALLHMLRQRLGRQAVSPGNDAKDEEIARLNAEIGAMRTQLRAMLEEHESAREELKSSEEELLSSNEEFQSTNEELEAAKEELQSLNEELSTTNDELRYRNHELKMVHDEVVSSRDYADAIIDTMSEPLLVLEPDLRVERANQAFYETFQTTPGNTIGTMLYSLGNRQWDIPALRELLEQVLPKKKAVRNFLITHAYEAIGSRTMRLNAARVTGPTHELIVLTIEDVTQHQVMVDQLERADRQKDEFLAMLGHELRNPLTAISNSLEIWDRKDVDSDTEERAKATAKRQLQHEIGLIDDLLDVSRITRGIVKLNVEPIDLNEIVQHGIAVMRIESDARQHALLFDPSTAPIFVQGDAMRLEQIVTNLLGNAIKYTPPNGTISVSLATDGGEATLTVADNGIGMAPDLLPGIFTIFVQAERSLDRKAGGLGLGLALVHRLVGLHQGTVRALSKGVGHGSTFVVRLPVMPVTDVNQCHPVVPDPTPNAHSTSPRRILIVDDNTDAAESTAMLLRLNGHEVDVATDGPTALQRAKSFRPDIVLLDIGLPGMDGYEVAREFRSTADLANIRLIAHSGYAGEEYVQRADEAGFDRHLVKPASITQLNDAIAQLSLS